MLKPAAAKTLLEKAALDNGFTEFVGQEGDWLVYASSKAPLRVWLGSFGKAVVMVGFSQANVAEALAEHGVPATSPMPPGAVALRTVPDFPSLHGMLRRAFQLSRTLPNELLKVYEKEVEATLGSTEVERIVKQRVGQEVFRRGLLEFWDGRCALTGLDVPELLRASHIKPWADCQTDKERLDVHNGLLLAAHLDAAFDRGLITLADDGLVVVAPELGEGAREVLGLVGVQRVKGLREQHRAYLPWHRERVFRGGKT